MARTRTQGKRLISRQSVNSAIKSICDIMRRSNCAGALQYVPELTWILFLRILDERETREAEEAEAVGVEYTPSLEAPYRWQDWAAPGGPKQGGTSERPARGLLRLRQRRSDPPPQESPREAECDAAPEGHQRTAENEEGFFVSSRDSAMREKGALNETARRRPPLAPAMGIDRGR